MHAYKFTYTTTNTDNRTVTVTETYYDFPTIRQVFANTRELFLKLASAGNYTYLYFAVYDDDKVYLESEYGEKN